MKRLVVIAVAIVLLSARSAAADSIIFDNGGPNQLNGWPLPGESFVLAPGATTITGVNWWGFCFDGISIFTCPTEDFTISFYEADFTLIKSYDVGSANQTPTGIPFDFTEFSFSATFAPLMLTAGTTYHLSIISSVLTPEWFWETSSASGSHWVFFEGEILSKENELAFNLVGPTVAAPEPGTISLIALGALGAAVRHRRRRATTPAVG